MSDKPQGKKPAKRGKYNRRNLRHGLTAGTLPLKCRHIENSTNVLRRNLEDALLASKGSISISDAATLNTVVKWERHGLLAHRWLRKEMANLSTSERLNFSREIAQASVNRDKAIKALKLDKDTKENIIEALYSRNQAEDS